jgi:hypothetical protein
MHGARNSCRDVRAGRIGVAGSRFVPKKAILDLLKFLDDVFRVHSFRLLECRYRVRRSRSRLARSLASQTNGRVLMRSEPVKESIDTAGAQVEVGFLDPVGEIAGLDLED